MRFYYYGTIEEFLESFEDPYSFAECMKRKAGNTSKEQIKAWEESFEHVKGLFEELKSIGLKNLICVFEYILPVIGERVDLLIIGKKDNSHIALVVELKGWRNENSYNSKFYKPEWQLIGYMEKLSCFNTAGRYFDFHGFLWFYNVHSAPHVEKRNVQGYTKTITVLRSTKYKEFAREVANLINKPPEKEKLEELLNGEYTQCKKLFELFKEKGPIILKEGSKALFASSFYPSEEQLEVVEEVLKAVDNNQYRVFFIKGGPGSGKTYIALMLLVEALSKKKSTILAYRNNRLLNTLRQVFCEYLPSSVVRFYSTGIPHNLGIAERLDKSYDLVIYDEAQRMEKENIEIALKRKDKVKVFLYDDSQILLPTEAGWEENFLETARMLDIKNYRKFNLSGYYRVEGGREYHDFVEKLLNEHNPKPDFERYELKVFKSIEEMIEALREKAKSHKVALVASFTESPGDRENKKSDENKNKKIDKNRRVGYPLHSGFELYKNSSVDIYWLMDEKEEYPKFWLDNESNNLTHCASVYGCQGFEADYVGVIWGRDLVWRNKWDLGKNCEDNVGGKNSLKNLFKKGKYDPKSKETAIKLLKNRYRIFLTRGIKGTYVFCEDEKTANYLSSLITYSTHVLTPKPVPPFE